MYLVRDDNRTTFELGKVRAGLHVPLQELGHPRTQLFVVTEEDHEPLTEFLLDGILDHGYWEQPFDYRPMATNLAARIIAWGEGQPMGVRDEHVVTELAIREEDPYIQNDSRFVSEWPYWDVFKTLDRTLQEQLATSAPPHPSFPAIREVRKHRMHEFAGLRRISQFRPNPNRGEGEPLMVEVTLEEKQAEFLDRLKSLKPFALNKQCGFWGCEERSPHDHGLRDTGPVEVRFCGCQCHDGEPIFCSCWVPCCHQPKTPRAQQTPRAPTPTSDVKLGDFNRFTMPVKRPEGGFPKLF